ncbi:hypothetical protein BBAD15_g10266 [Beauveria bassiana D1-5]|uniref:Uncharacterized protein n=1 Tax=Beauveria bassiana D1-5 TaxID=1245745 RepID=A0A0A2V9C8_BEABA|nr:hypothetical protein BBAD15_g10266 [Beauveria bassiana D1-5]
MTMNDHNSQDDRSDDDDIALRRRKLIDFAITQLKAARHCIPELEALLVALAPKVKSVFATGLVTFVRDLIHDVRTIEAVLQEPALRQALPPPQQHHEEDEEDEEEGVVVSADGNGDEDAGGGVPPTCGASSLARNPKYSDAARTSSP